MPNLPWFAVKNNHWLVENFLINNILETDKKNQTWIFLSLLSRNIERNTKRTRLKTLSASKMTRKMKWQTKLQLLFWQSLLFFRALIAIMTIPNCYSDNPRLLFWQSLIGILTSSNYFSDNPQFLFWQSLIAILTIPNYYSDNP